tara:strand:- start:3 stop:245 length:243 start_codon:yes stop_codon:yes gene_type:complete
MIETLKIHEHRADLGGMNRINSNPNSHGYFLDCMHKNIFRQKNDNNNTPMEVIRLEKEKIDFESVSIGFIYSVDVIVKYK